MIPKSKNEEWIITESELCKTFRFESFLKAIDWMREVAQVIDSMDHHPRWINSYKDVEVHLTTHSSGNRVTQKDWELASAMDANFVKING